MIRTILFLFTIISNPLFSQEKDKDMTYSIFPNPANEFINLKIDNNSIDDYNFSIHSLIGNQMDFQQEKISDNEMRFVINSFNSGYYFILIDFKNENRRRIIKFSKKIAVANKEAIICGWSLIKKALKKNNTKFLPVDSEHFSIWSLIKNHQNPLTPIG